MAKTHFIGGIHGVGKGTICKKVCDQFDIIYLSASELLKWNEISEIDNKKVVDINNTQDRLIAGFRNATKGNSVYLLDGHCSLFNALGEIERVPLETFEKIAPNSITVVTEKPEIIKSRLEERDNQLYDLEVLLEMQNIEIEYAEKISSHLNIPFVVIKNGDFQPLIDVLK